MSRQDDQSELRELDQKLTRVEAEREKLKNPPEGDRSAMGTAFRLSSEFVIAIFVGAFIGWHLDGWLGTKPWLLVLFLMLGFGAGIKLVFRSAAEMDNRARKARENADDE